MQHIEIPNICEYIEGDEIRLDRYVIDIAIITQLTGYELKLFLYNHVGLDLFNK